MKGMFAFLAFLATFVTLYGLLNFYFYRKLTGCFHPDTAGRALLAAFLLLMVFAPFLVNFSAGAGFRNTALASAYIGYTWMGAVFLFFCVHVFLDAAFASRWIFLRVTGGSPGAVFEKRCAVLAVSTAVVLAGIVWGFFDARDIRVEHIRLTSDKIPPLHRTIRIAQVSDTHFGVITGERFAAKLAELLDGIRADVIVSTGDMIDRGLPEPEKAAKILRAVHSPMGKYAVAGNHEFYAGIKDAAAFHETAGFVLLRNRVVAVSEFLTIAGVDDPAGRRYGLETDFSGRSLLADVHPDSFSILLKHQPVPAEGLSSGFDLQLSGHTHHGQIFPFNFIVRLVYPDGSGLHRLEGGSQMYVSRGTGFWGPPIRLFAPPEITVIDIAPAS